MAKNPQTTDEGDERERAASGGDRVAAREGVAPEQTAATAPHFPVLSEPHHSAEFILSEANGQRSRGAAYFADPTQVYVGMPVKKTAEATAIQPAAYVPAAVGADCMALCIYAGGTIPGEGLRTAVIVRDAEVNKNLISWGAITAPEQVIGAQTLATNGIIVR
ncbi:head decoration protein [Bradyrhizobium sp. S3.9.1]|uniref:head decoration protein n=1 Tax=Bradyrhizobium sp. S3.9.1 TaxID=3156431 RepID=UPI003393F3DE